MTKDLFERIREEKGPIGNWADKAEGYYVFPKLEGPISNRMFFNGKKVITWSVNDYLGLANHPDVLKTDGEAAMEHGMAYPMGARMMSGHTKYHEQLEQECAEFVGKEAAYLVNFGYQGMVSAIDALVGKNDIIVYDVDTHACIIDGVRLHPGKRFVYKHNDIESFEKNMKRAVRMAEKTGGGILAISEGVFGMRGEQGRLKEIVELKKKYNFRFLVDDAHGFGTLGEGGRGTGFEQGVQDGIDVYFATFAKSMAGIGAFFAGDKDIVQYLQYNMRSQMFAKSLPMPMVKGALKRLDMIRTMPELKDKLWENTHFAIHLMRSKGLDIGYAETPIIPVYIRNSAKTFVIAKALFDEGIYVNPVVAPGVKETDALLRFSLTAAHSKAQITYAIDKIATIVNQHIRL